MANRSDVASAKEALRRRRANRMRRSLAEFVKGAWHVIEPTTPLVWNWHLDVVCDHLQALLERRLGRRNLIINVPPGSMKSTIVSVCAPAWVWIQEENGPNQRLGPTWRGLFASGGPDLALRDAMKCRDILDSEWYREIFQPSWGFSKDQNAKNLYKNTATGSRKSLSSGAKVTGERGDDIFVDDPLDAKLAFSKPAREEGKLWWDNAFGNRLNDLKTGGRIIIMQRLHEEDLCGHVLSKEPDAWDVLKIRQEYEPPDPKKDPVKPTSLTLGAMLARNLDPDATPKDRAMEEGRLRALGYTEGGWIDPRSLPGELMFPARFPVEVLDSEKIRLGSTGYAGQHQQRPSPLSGNFFKRPWFDHTYPLAPMVQRGQIQRIVQSWDTAAKKDQLNDYSVCTTWGIAQHAYYLLDVWKGKVEFPDLKKQVQALAAKWRPSAILVEDTSAGVGVLQELGRNTHLPLLGVTVPTDKVARARTASPTFEAGNVLMPADPPAWVADYVDTMCMFPAGHDDEVDSTTQFINWANANGGQGEIRGGGERVSTGSGLMAR